MKLAILAFTRSGSKFAKRISETYEEKGDTCICRCKGKAAADWGIPVLEGSLRAWIGEMFGECDSLLFIGAAGIAVRAIAPFVESKASDPAVLVMDEQGHFVISLLSGHLGGANALARELASLLGALPVITTATDAGGRFSVDDFARRENLYLENLALAKAVAADILEQRTVGLYSDFELVGQVPPELSIQKREGLGISISVDETYDPFPRTLHLVPRIAALGIGCKKGTSKEQIEELVTRVLAENQLSRHAISRVASVDLKKEEPGLLAFCEAWGLPFQVYTAEELSEAECEGGFSESAFVREITGVGNICERSALLAAGRKKLFQRKVAQNGVTAAIALEEYTVNFG